MLTSSLFTSLLAECQCNSGRHQESKSPGDYLTSKDGAPSKNFINFAEKKIGDYINELSERKVQKLRGRLKRLLESETVDGTRLWQSLAADQGGYRTLDEYVSVLLEPRGTGVTSGTSDLIFSYAEWKSNDVAFGEQTRERGYGNYLFLQKVWDFQNLFIIFATEYIRYDVSV